MIISSTLKWDEHVAMICSKTASKIHFLKIIRRAGISQADALCFYMTVIRLEYACPAWHSMLTKKLSFAIESQQIRVMRIIYGDVKYDKVLVTAGIPTLYDRREKLTSNFFRSIRQPSSCLHHLIPARRMTETCFEAANCCRIYNSLLQNKKISNIFPSILLWIWRRLLIEFPMRWFGGH